MCPAWAIWDGVLGDPPLHTDPSAPLSCIKQMNSVTSLAYILGRGTASLLFSWWTDQTEEEERGDRLGRQIGNLTPELGHQPDWVKSSSDKMLLCILILHCYYWVIKCMLPGRSDCSVSLCPVYRSSILFITMPTHWTQCQLTLIECVIGWGLPIFYVVHLVITFLSELTVSCNIGRLCSVPDQELWLWSEY